MDKGGKRRVARYLWIIASLMLVVTSVGLLYYYEIQGRERYYNQLRLRELGAAARGFDNQLASLVTLTREHRRLIDEDIGGIRSALDILTPADSRLPLWRYDKDVVSLVRAQAGLMLFDDNGCLERSGGEASANICPSNCYGAWTPTELTGVDAKLVEGFGQRGLDWLGGLLEGREGPPGHKNIIKWCRPSLCEEVSSLARAMCYAGNLAPKSVNELRDNKGNIQENVEVLLKEPILNEETLSPGKKESWTGLYKESGTAPEIARGLLEAFDGFLFALTRLENGVPEKERSSEELTQFVQKMIADFWKGELRGGEVGRVREDRLRRLVAQAHLLDREKSRQAMDRLFELVKKRFTNPRSPLNAALDKHQLPVEFQVSRGLPAPGLCKIDDYPRLPVVLRNETPSIYPSKSRYMVSSCLLKANLAYVIPFSSLLNESGSPFAVQIIADPEGNILYSTDAGGLERGDFSDDIASLIDGRRSAGRSGGKNTAAASPRELVDGYLPVVLPHELDTPLLNAPEIRNGRSADGGQGELKRLDTVYFVGLVPADVARKQSLRLQPAYYVAGFAIALLILLSFVFLKLAIAGLNEATTRWDRRKAVLAMLTIALLVPIGAATLLFGNSLGRDFERNANRTLHKIAGDFEAELRAAMNYVSGSLAHRNVLGCLVTEGRCDLADEELRARKDMVSPIASEAGFSGSALTIEGDSPADGGMVVCLIDKSRCRLFAVGRPSPLGILKAPVSSLFGKSETLSALTFVEGNLANEHILGCLTDEARCDVQAVNMDTPPLKAREEPVSSLFGKYVQAYFLPSPGNCHSRFSRGSLNCKGIDNLFLLTPEGRNRGNVLRGAEKLVQSIQKPDVSERRYFHQALDRREYRWRTGKQGEEIPVALERIVSIVSGDKSTQVAIPVGPLCDPGKRSKDGGLLSSVCDWESNPGAGSGEQSISNDILSFGLYFESLASPVLPNALQYAIFDNSSGRVLFHSREERSLVENFLAETEHDPRLLAFIEAYGGEHRGSAEPVMIDGKYRGEATRFYARSLHPDIPWTLVVFHSREYVFATPILMFCISFLAALIFLVLAWLASEAWRLLGSTGPYQHLWPCPDQVPVYRAMLGPLLLALLVLLALPVDQRALLWAVGLGVLLLVAVLWRWMQRDLQSWLPGSATAYKSVRQWYDSMPEKNRQLLTQLWKRVRDGLPGLTASYAGFMSCLLAVLVMVPALMVADVTGEQLIRALQRYDAHKALEDATRRTEVLQNYYHERGELAEEERRRKGQLAVELAAGVKEGYDEDNWLLLPNTGHGDLAATGFGSSCQSRDWLGDTLSVIMDRIGSLWQPAGRISYLLDEDLAGSGAEPDKRGKESACAFDYHYPGAVTLFGRSINDALAQGHRLLLVWWLLVALVVVAAVFYLVRFLGIHLLGLRHPPAAPPDSGDHPRDRQALLDALGGAGPAPHHAILVMPQYRCLDLGDGTVAYPVDARVLAAEGRGPIELDTVPGSGRGQVLLIDHMEGVAFCAVERQRVLERLEDLVYRRRDVSVVLLSDRWSLGILVDQAPCLVDPLTDDRDLHRDQCAGPAESLRWSTLLSRFSTYRDWVPDSGRGAGGAEDPWQRELGIWSELACLKEHLASKSQPEQPERENRDPLREEDLQRILAHTQSIYRHRWNLCTLRERLALYQIARGMVINPRNTEVLERLAVDGYIVRDTRWEIANRSFRRFVLGAEPEAVFTEWMNSTHRGLWSFLKVPLLGFAVAIIAMIVISTQKGWESSLAVLTGIFTLVPLVLKNINLFNRGGGEPPLN